ASALMQGLADGYFVVPYTVGTFLSKEIRTPKFSTDLPEFADAENAVQGRLQGLLNIKGKHTVDDFHRQLGKIMWNKCGMARTAEGLTEALADIPSLREEFYREVYVPGTMKEFNPELEKAHRVADFLELGQMMCMDALHRNESCGGHFREEYQTPEGEALRDDENFAYVAAWEWSDVEKTPELRKERLVFEEVELKARSYK
ncbi:MAG: fumarate reductase/succinate dehydrogenase flavoprotein subunit, partial [Bacteroidota bacterium]